MVRMPRLPLLAAAILLTPLLSTTQSATQSPTPAAPRPLMLITWFGPGAIALPNGPDWKPQSLTVYDKGTRPVAQLTHGDVAASFIVFENQSGTPTAQGCRADAIELGIQHADDLRGRAPRSTSPPSSKPPRPRQPLPPSSPASIQT